MVGMGGLAMLGGFSNVMLDRSGWRTFVICITIGRGSDVLRGC